MYTIYTGQADLPYPNPYPIPDSDRPGASTYILIQWLSCHPKRDTFIHSDSPCPDLTQIKPPPPQPPTANPRLLTPTTPTTTTQTARDCSSIHHHCAPTARFPTECLTTSNAHAPGAQQATPITTTTMTTMTTMTSLCSPASIKCGQAGRA